MSAPPTIEPPAAAPVGAPGLDELMTEHGDAVLRLAVVMLRDRALAEDVFQDVFVRAYAGRRELRDPASTRAWLLAITANRCRDELRSWSRRTITFVAELPEPPPGVDAEPAGLELDPELGRAILELPLPFREAIVLHYAFELSVAEIARVAGVTPITVRTRLHRGRAALRRALTQEETTHA